MRQQPENIADDKIDQIVIEFKGLGVSCEDAVSYFNILFRHNQACTQDSLDASLFSKPSKISLSTKLREALLLCSALYFAKNQSEIELANSRITLLRTIVRSLHQHYPEYKNIQPEINYADELKGMKKIRILVCEFLSKVRSQWDSIECPLLAAMIVREKHRLNLPCRDPISKNMYTLQYGNADLSHLGRP